MGKKFYSRGMDGLFVEEETLHEGKVGEYAKKGAMIGAGISSGMNIVNIGQHVLQHGTHGIGPATLAGVGLHIASDAVIGGGIGAVVGAIRGDHHQPPAQKKLAKKKRATVSLDDFEGDLNKDAPHVPQISSRNVSKKGSHMKESRLQATTAQLKGKNAMNDPDALEDISLDYDAETGEWICSDRTAPDSHFRGRTRAEAIGEWKASVETAGGDQAMFGKESRHAMELPDAPHPDTLDAEDVIGDDDGKIPPFPEVMYQKSYQESKQAFGGHNRNYWGANYQEAKKQIPEEDMEAEDADDEEGEEGEVSEKKKTKPQNEEDVLAEGEEPASMCKGKGSSGKMKESLEVAEYVTPFVDRHSTSLCSQTFNANEANFGLPARFNEAKALTCDENGIVAAMRRVERARRRR